MSYLAGTILVYCTEPEAFICFSNFVHQHFFIKLFTGYIPDIKLKISIFKSYFKVILPDLYKLFLQNHLDPHRDLKTLWILQEPPRSFEAILDLYGASETNQTLQPLLDPAGSS